MSGATAVWDRDDTEVFDSVTGQGDCEPGPVLDNLVKGGFIVRQEANELAIL